MAADSTPLGSVIVNPDGSKHVVDYAGTRLLSEGRGGWDCALAAANWPAWVEFARIVLAVEESVGDPNGGY